MKNELVEKHIFIIVVFILLLAISFPSLSYPPLSDHWEMFYFFHHLDEKPGAIKWLHILNHDPCEHMRYQPLSRVFFYIPHLLFGSNFIFFNIFNFLFYFFSIYLLYKFALIFSKNRGLVALFIGLFAFLFSHFDIVLWSFHIYILAGFCMLLVGFMSYVRYLKTGRFFLLFWVILLLLLGTLCYEPFFLWPFAIVILSCIKHLRARGPNRGNVVRVNCLVLSIVYAFYFLFYLFTRSLKTYERPVYEISQFLKLSNFTATGFLVLFNTLYNNIAVNIFPFLTFPFKVTENIFMRGPIINYIDNEHLWVVFIVGGLVGISLVWSFIYLYRKKHLEELKVIGFFVFLMLSEPYIIFFCRVSVINAFVYNLTAFRYQYIPNVFIVLIILFIIDRFLKLSKYRKRIVSFLLILIFVFNIYCIRRVINIYNYHLINLKKMLSNIETGIRQGAINKDNKLYIDTDMPDYLPGLCWNIYMGERFIKKGNYQWMFSRSEIEYFSESLKDATWIIDKEDFSVIKESSKDTFKKAKKIYSEKIEQFMNLANFYVDQKQYKEAEKMFKKAIEMNPKNDEAYIALGKCYKIQGKYKEAGEILNRPKEINLENN